YGTHQLAEDPVEEAALVQMTLEGFLVEATPPQIPEHLENAHEHDNVDRGDEGEEAPGPAGADDGGELVQAGRAVAHRSGERADAERQQQAEQEDDARV